MTEPTFTVVVTIIGIAYVLTYLWAQLEILAHVLGSWRPGNRAVTLLLCAAIAAVNCFVFLLAHDVHYSMIRRGSLNFLGHEETWAKALASATVIAYWIWVGWSLHFAGFTRKEARRAERENNGTPE